MMAAVDFSAEVEAQLVGAFPADVVDEARGILNPSQADRVLRAILTLSEGDLERLRHYPEVAETGNREVLYWAETPRQSDEPRTYEEVRDRLKQPPRGLGRSSS
jgi:hypothetical protein